MEAINTSCVLCIACVLITSICSIVTNIVYHKRINQIYELFGYLQKASEERIGRANSIVEQCTRSIEHAAVAAGQCADVAKEMVRVTEKIAHENSKQIEELRHDKNKMFEQMAALTAQNAIYQHASDVPKINYTTNNN